MARPILQVPVSDRPLRDPCLTDPCTARALRYHGPLGWAGCAVAPAPHPFQRPSLLVVTRQFLPLARQCQVSCP